MNKSIEESQNVNSIFNRIIHHYGLKNDADLAKFLGMNATTLSMHRKRGSPDYGKIISTCSDADLNWIFRGRAVADGSVSYAGNPSVKEELLSLADELKRKVERL